MQETIAPLRLPSDDRQRVGRRVTRLSPTSAIVTWSAWLSVSAVLVTAVPPSSAWAGGSRAPNPDPLWNAYPLEPIKGPGATASSPSSSDETERIDTTPSDQAAPSPGSVSDASTKPRSGTTSGGDRRLNDPMTRFLIILVSLGLGAGLLFSAVVDIERVRRKVRDVVRALGTRFARRRPSLTTPLTGSRSMSPPAPDLADDLLRSTRGKGASLEGGSASAAERIDSYSFRAQSDVRRQPDSRAITDSAATIAPARPGPGQTESPGFREAQPRKAGTAEAWLERELEAAVPEKSPVSLLLVRPNSIGTGDAKATSVAEVVNGIEQELADVSFALRREDDVVLVVLPATRSETAKRIAKRIELFLPRRAGDVGGRETAVTTAVTDFPRDGTGADELIGAAREAIRRQAPSRSEHVSRGQGRES